MRLPAAVPGLILSFSHSSMFLHQYFGRRAERDVTCAARFASNRTSQYVLKSLLEELQIPIKVQRNPSLSEHFRHLITEPNPAISRTINLVAVLFVRQHPGRTLVLEWLQDISHRLARICL